MMGKVATAALALCLGAFLFMIPAYASAEPPAEGAPFSVDEVWLTGDTLHVAVTDRDGGGGRTLELNLSDYAKPADEYVTIQAADSGGNTSDAVRFKNPYYAPQTEAGANPEESGAEPSETTEDGGVLPAGDDETSESAVPDGGNPFTPDGAGSVVDDVTDGYPESSSGKEFFTVETADGNVFYLIVDRERTSDNVYFLNAVTERDLLSLAQPDGAEGESAIPAPEPPAGPTASAPEPEPSAVSPAPAETGGGMGSGSLIFIVLAALVAGGAGYYFKILRPKKQAAMDDDEEGYDDPDEPEDGDEDDYSDDFREEGGGV